MKKYQLTILALLIVIFFLLAYIFRNSTFDSPANISESPIASISVDSFSECVAAGNPVMESYPRQCRHKGKLFVEEIGNELEKQNLIRLSTPRPNAIISSPLEIRGEARGTWFFEGDFPVSLTNWDGLIIAEGYATAQGEWMTEEFVPFEVILEFDQPELYPRGSLILQKDNPSGLPEHDDALEIPVWFWEQ